LYAGEHLNKVAFPLGGIGAGMICLEGTGALSHVSLRHHPDILHEPYVYAALSISGDRPLARVLEGPVPLWKAFGNPGTGLGLRERTWGLPRFATASFVARFPFATVTLTDPHIPLTVELTGWSPFIPGDADASSLPVAALEYTFTNNSHHPIDATFSFHAVNFMATRDGGERVEGDEGGFVLYQPGTEEKPWAEGALKAWTNAPGATVNCAWFRGRSSDSKAVVWNEVVSGVPISREPIKEGIPSPGGSLYVPLRVEPGETKQVRLMLAWYVPYSNLRTEPRSDQTSNPPSPLDSTAFYKPWYAAHYNNVNDVAAYFSSAYDNLRKRSQVFIDAFYDTTLPPEVVEAVAANLTILKSPTVLRQTDGRIWGWEGCNDKKGSCAGSCTHVWNYAQALAHLFPELERSLRETEFNEAQTREGRQSFRVLLPIRETPAQYHPAADGQLGGILRVYRDWRISGDTTWLRSLWPKVKASLDFCIEKWDPNRIGVLVEPHHNTYDIEFWGPDGMCGSIYLGALKAFVLMGEALDEDVDSYRELLDKGKRYVEDELFDGEYFLQKVQWKGLRDEETLYQESRNAPITPEVLDLMQREGPRYQYGAGCLADGVIGAWMAEVCGVGEILDNLKVRSHLQALYKYNFRKDLSDHANTYRPTFALGKEGGLLLCTWPKGQKPTIPFYFATEVWTGIEYQVASHMMRLGLVQEGLEIVRTCRNRYDGRVRNPFNEYECGHWYARAMASYALIYGLTGVRYDRVTKTLYIEPTIAGDFRSFLATESGFAIVGVREGQPFIEVRSGSIPVDRTVFVFCRE
jgi:uncharacterized protein (DUF608 family)